MWTEIKPIESGYYWFYGDPFWDQLPHDEARGINPFKPEMVIIQAKYVRPGFTMLVCRGALVHKFKGKFWDEKIEPPVFTDDEVSKKIKVENALDDSWHDSWEAHEFGDK